MQQQERPLWLSSVFVDAIDHLRPGTVMPGYWLGNGKRARGSGPLG
jgi:hypothetical protein